MSDNEKKILNDEQLDSVSGGSSGNETAEQEGRIYQVVAFRYVAEVGGTRRFEVACGRCGVQGNMYAKSVDEATGKFIDVKCYSCEALYPWINTK